MDIPLMSPHLKSDVIVLQHNRSSYIQVFVVDVRRMSVSFRFSPL